MTPKYNTETRDGMPPEPSPWETDYEQDEPHLAQQEHQRPYPYPLASGQNLAARGFAQTCGFHFTTAFVTIVADTMIFGGDIASAGLLLPVALGGAVMLGLIAYLIQKKYYGDDHEAAFIKALIVALLTAIPSPLPSIFCLSRRES